LFSTVKQNGSNTNYKLCRKKTGGEEKKPTWLWKPSIATTPILTSETEKMIMRRWSREDDREKMIVRRWSREDDREKMIARRWSREDDHEKMIVRRWSQEDDREKRKVKKIVFHRTKSVVFFVFYRDVPAASPGAQPRCLCPYAPVSPRKAYSVGVCRGIIRIISKGSVSAYCKMRAWGREPEGLHFATSMSAEAWPGVKLGRKFFDSFQI
jgi:hypothetical protein